ncbi:kinase-like domain-containing protein [Mycena polygramma]|nr:kinase-like domain-containing protein [Mycena polygramma]
MPFFVFCLLAGSPVALILLLVYTGSLKKPCFAVAHCAWTFRKEDWAHCQDFLSQRGLLLYGSEEFHEAPRPCVGPAPSPFHPQDDEDFVFRLRSKLIRTPRNMWCPPRPAIQLALETHKREVMIKAVAPRSPEAQILKRLASSPLRNDPQNHTIPVMDILHCDRATFLVHARWGSWWSKSPPCTLAFWAGVQAYQLLGGLAFMRSNGIIHGDIYTRNILCNFSDSRSRTADHSIPCPIFENFKNGPNYRVAFIDFGQSLQFSSIGPHYIPSPRTICGPPPGFRAPEIDQCTTFEPFSADVFSLGRLLMDLDPPVMIPAAYQTLLDDMTNENPSARPSAHTVYQRLQALNEKEWSDDDYIPAVYPQIVNRLNFPKQALRSRTKIRRKLTCELQ